MDIVIIQIKQVHEEMAHFQPLGSQYNLDGFCDQSVEESLYDRQKFLFLCNAVIVSDERGGKSKLADWQTGKHLLAQI